MIRRSPSSDTVVPHATAHRLADRPPTWRAVLARWVLALVPLALLWAASAPLAALTLVAAGTTLAWAVRTVPRDGPSSVRRAVGAMGRALGRVTDS